MREVNNVMDRKLHVCIQDDCYIHYYLDRVQIRKGLYDFLEVNTFQASILKACESSPTVNELMEMILQYNRIENTEHNRNHIEKLIELFEKKGIINLEDKAIPFSLSYFGEFGKTYPAWIILEVTSNCNLKCSFCYKSASYNGTYINMAHIDSIIDHFAGKCKNLVLTGGEALLHPQIEEIIRKTAEVFDVSLLTNGLLLSRINSNLLKMLVHIQVSIYGYNNELYENNTGIKKGFDILKSSYRNIPHGINTTLVVTVVLNKSNVNYIEEYIKAAYAMGAPAIHFGLMLPLGKGAGDEAKELFLENEEINNAIAIIDQLYDIYKDRIYISKLSEVKETIPVINDEFACQAGKTNIVISQDGLIRACNLLPEEVFSEYSLNEYIDDVESGKHKCYSKDILRFKKYLLDNGCDISDMKCVGFCELKGD